MSPIVAEISQSIIHALIPFLMAFGMRWLKQRTDADRQQAEWLKQKAYNEAVEADQGKVRAAMAALSDICDWVVAEVEQTLVKRVRDNVGSLPPDLAEQAKQRAVGRVKEIYGADGMDKLGSDLDVTEKAVCDIISARIEAAVLKIKYPTAPQSQRFDPAVFGGMTEAEKAQAAHPLPPSPPPVPPPPNTPVPPPPPSPPPPAPGGPAMTSPAFP